MPHPSIKLIMIPGSGTDWRMYAPQLEQFPFMVIPEWLPPLGLKEPLKAYAARFAATIDTSEPFVLGGVSLGGMLAQEMTRTLKPLGLILIATCSTSKALPWSKRMAGRFTRACPDTLVKCLFNLMSHAALATPFKHKALYAAMLREISPRLVRWQSGAATKWQLKDSLTMPVFWIHGSKDKIIPAKKVPAQIFIPDGGHLINVTHQNEVNAFIRQSMGSF